MWQYGAAALWRTRLALRKRSDPRRSQRRAADFIGSVYRESTMKFSIFIKDNMDAIVADWEAFARTLPSAQAMSTLALRDHSREILLAIAEGMEVQRTDSQRAAQSRDIAPPAGSATTAAAEHGALRQMAGFDLVQLFAEFRAMRASVLAFWHKSESANGGDFSADEVIRFNEGLDQALAESIERYSSEVAASRDMFLAVLGHDLRGPLAGIDMSAVLLLKPGLLETARQQAAQRITRSSREMNRLITDLLEYTRTRLGAGIPIARSLCDLGPVCEESLEAIRVGCPEQEFVHRMSGDLSIEADAPRIQQALSNLLNNAVSMAIEGRRCCSLQKARWTPWC